MCLSNTQHDVGNTWHTYQAVVKGVYQAVLKSTHHTVLKDVFQAVSIIIRPMGVSKKVTSSLSTFVSEMFGGHSSALDGL